MSSSGNQPRAYSATISGLEVWCSRDCLGRLLIGFFSELDALAAAEFHNVQITITQSFNSLTGLWFFQAIYTIPDPRSIALHKTSFVAVEPDSEKVVSAFYETYGALVASLRVKHEPEAATGL